MAGSDRYPGAAHLVLQGVMVSGCGNVQAVVLPRLQSSFWQVLPEVMQLEDQLIADRLNAVLVGPGLWEPSRWWNQWTQQMLSISGLVVLDADGINGLVASPEGWRWLLQRQGPTWLPPMLPSSRGYFQTLMQVMRLTGRLPQPAAAVVAFC